VSIPNGNYRPNAKGATSWRTARPLYVGNDAVSVDVYPWNGGQWMTIFIGCSHKSFEGPMPASIENHDDFYAFIHEAVETFAAKRDEAEAAKAAPVKSVPFARASREYHAHIKTCECGQRTERCARGERLHAVYRTALDEKSARDHAEAVATGREITIGNSIPEAWFRARLKRYALLPGTSETTAQTVREVADRARTRSFRMAWYEFAHVYAAVHKTWGDESEISRTNRATVLSALKGF
jgi:hypothetical protein